jgi:sulfate permease, SulP family
MLRASPKNLHLDPLVINLKYIPRYFLKPVRFLKTYNQAYLRADLTAGLTVAIISLPLSIAFTLLAELPPEMGIYTSIVGGIVGALWGSSNQTYTGPSNTISLLVLSALSTTATTGTPEFIVAAGLLAVMAGLFQLIMGLARLGVLVNFVSHSVIVGFATGAGVLITVNQLPHLLGLNLSGRNLVETLSEIFTHFLEIQWPTALLGLGTIGLIILLRNFAPKLPGSFISMIVPSIVVYLLHLNAAGVKVIGELPSHPFPPLAELPLLDLSFIARLSTGALAVAAIGLVQTMAIARSITAQTGQRVDSNQEFVGQGLANIVVGFLSGYPCAGSFSCSAVNLKVGAKTPLSVILSSSFVFLALFFFAPLAAYLPRTALAGVLIVTAYGMINRTEIMRIMRGARGDALIMLATFLGTLFLHIEFAVLMGILLSFAYYIMKTSVPRVYSVLPSRDFKHFVQQPADQPSCPQLGIIKISGDLYFGAVNHVEEAIIEHLDQHPEQRFLLLRMQGVNQCDFSGIHMLEMIMRACRERGGDLYLMKVQKPVDALMRSVRFYDKLGKDHILAEDEAISYLFHKILDPVICIYECNVRAFKECQNLPKQHYALDIPLYTATSNGNISEIPPYELRQKLRDQILTPVVIDVREPREYKGGHIPEALLIPLPDLLSKAPRLNMDREIIFVCRSGRRSRRAAQALKDQGHPEVSILQGGMLAWEAAHLLEAIER